MSTDKKPTFTASQRVKRWVANRILPDNIAKAYDTPFPVNFAQPFPLTGETPPGSGLAFKFSPYMQFYTKVYGVMPNSDFTKYRLIYRTQPDVKARIDKRVNLAIGKGFTIQCEDPAGDEAAQWLNQWAKKIKLPKMLTSAASDMLVYGTAFLELVWSAESEVTVPINPGETEKDSSIRGPLRAWVEEQAICPKCHEYTLTGIRYLDGYTFYGDVASFQSWICSNQECKTDPMSPQSTPYCSATSADEFMGNLKRITEARYEGQDIKVIQPVPPEAGSTITYIKDLDPLYIRPRADAYGNIFGYYQWINYPPVLLGPAAVICFRWNIKSWGYETIFGTSELMPVIRYWDFRQQLENDLATWVHTYAKPTVHLMAGTPVNPYADAAMRALALAWKQRKAGADMLTKGDITSEVIETTVGRGNTLVEWLNYIQTMMHNPLGIPDVLMGTAGSPTGGGGSNRSTASVTMEDVIVQAQLLEADISRPFEQDVFPVLLRGQGFPEEVCQLEYRMIWKPIFEEDPNTLSERVVKQRTACLLSINEGRDQIPDVGSIDKTDARYKLEMDDPMYVSPAPAKSGGEPGMGEPGSSGLAPDSSTMPEGIDQGEGMKVSASTNKRYVTNF